jgi:hypothetical protein
MKIRGIEVSKIEAIVIERRIIWCKLNDGWSRKISNSNGIEVKKEYRTQQHMVDFLNTKYLNNHKYKVWISPCMYYPEIYKERSAYNTLNIVRAPTPPPTKPNPQSNRQIKNKRCNVFLVELKKAFKSRNEEYERMEETNKNPEKEECKGENKCMCRIPVYDPNVDTTVIVRKAPEKEDE